MVYGNGMQPFSIKQPSPEVSQEGTMIANQ